VDKPANAEKEEMTRSTLARHVCERALTTSLACRRHSFRLNGSPLSRPAPAPPFRFSPSTRVQMGCAPSQPLAPPQVWTCATIDAALVRTVRRFSGPT
jgi:hypothetical protein